MLSGRRKVYTPFLLFFSTVFQRSQRFLDQQEGDWERSQGRNKRNRSAARQAQRWRFGCCR